MSEVLANISLGTHVRGVQVTKSIVQREGQDVIAIGLLIFPASQPVEQPRTKPQTPASDNRRKLTDEEKAILTQAAGIRRQRNDSKGLKDETKYWFEVVAELDFPKADWADKNIKEAREVVASSSPVMTSDEIPF